MTIRFDPHPEHRSRSATSGSGYTVPAIPTLHRLFVLDHRPRFLIHLRVLGCGTGDSMGMRCAVETYCPRGRLVHAVEYDTLDQARAAYEAELAAMPESLPALRWAGQQLARTKPLHDLQTREWERSMNDTLHGRDPVGLGLPWSHPEAARAWG